MTGLDAIDYLGLQDACLSWVERDSNLTIIEFAMDRGYFPGDWLELTIEAAIAAHNGETDGFDYEGDIDADLKGVSIEAVEFLNQAGLLPEGYGKRPELAGDGYGFTTEIEEGS